MVELTARVGEGEIAEDNVAARISQPPHEGLEVGSDGDNLVEMSNRHDDVVAGANLNRVGVGLVVARDGSITTRKKAVTLYAGGARPVDGRVQKIEGVP